MFFWIIGALFVAYIIFRVGEVYGETNMIGTPVGNDNRESGDEDEETPLEDLTVKQLKALLRERDLPVSGRKAELIERLTQ